MNGLLVLGISVVVGLIGWYEWSVINRRARKERGVLITLLALGWILSSLLVYFPDLPGPTQLMEKLSGPFGQWMKE